jgi:pantothenate synthetase
VKTTVVEFCSDLKAYVRIFVVPAVTMKNAVAWNIKNQFVPHRKHYVSAKELGKTLAVTSNRSTLLVAQMMEKIRYSETSVFTRATRRNIQEHRIFCKLTLWK